jgi:cytochrome P450
MNLPFMDMIINETLRLYPPGLRVERACSQDYTYNGLEIKKGQVWSGLVFALHHDPEIYPDPYKFDPERFNEQNRKSRENEAFQGFGAGPRNCVASRFAMVVMKIALATVLSKFQFEKCEKTVVSENLTLFFLNLVCIFYRIIQSFLNVSFEMQN